MLSRIGAVPAALPEMVDAQDLRFHHLAGHQLDPSLVVYRQCLTSKEGIAPFEVVTSFRTFPAKL
jgi:hypothetical protein